MCEQTMGRNKRMLLAAVIAAFALGALVLSTQVVSAETVAEGTCGTNASWVLDDGGTLTISGEGAISDYESPDETPWYEHTDSIKKVIVGLGITRIGSHSFDSLWNMSDVEIADSVTEIGYRAFIDSGIREVDLPESLVKLEGDAFAITGITTVTLHGKVTEIGSSVFWKCKSLEAVVIEEGVTAVGESMFMACSNLKSITLPDTITTIGSGAFYACSSLENIQLPEQITIIESSTFRDCSNLKSIMLPAGLKSIDSSSFSGCTGLQTADFPETLESIGEDAFRGCTGINSIIIPKDVSVIGNGAFTGCSNLESIIFQCPAPAVITSAIAAFTGTAYYPANDEFWDEETRTAWAPDATWVAEGNVDVTVVASGECGEHATWELTNQGMLYVRGTGQMADYDPNTVSPFYEYRSAIKKVIIEDGITSVGAVCFSGRGYTTVIESVELPETITSIGASAFNGCTSLKEIDLPDSVKSIGAYAFHNCGSLTEVTLPEGLEELGESAFGGCNALETIEIPDSLTALGDCAFEDCINLKSLSLPGNIDIIPGQIVRNCTSLESVRFRSMPPGRYISTAFSGFDGVIYYPENVEFWDEETRTAWAPNATWIANGNADVSIVASGDCGDNATWTLNSIGMLYVEGSGELRGYTSWEETPWYKYADDIKGVSLSNGIETIGEHMFEGCALSKVVFPNTLVVVKEYAFESCLNLKQVDLPNSLRTIEHGAFRSCGFNNHLELPEGLVEIGNYAFEGCSNVKTVSIPSTVLRIGQTAFGSGIGVPTALETVSFHCSAPAVNDGDVFEQFSGTVYYPEDDEFWDEAARNEWAPDANWVPEGKLNVTEITKGTCGNNTNWMLDSQGIIHIKGKGKMYDYSNVGIAQTNSPWNAYRKCIKKAVVEDGVTSVGAYSFGGCEGMLQLDIAKSVTTLGNFVLYETPKLKIIRLKCPAPLNVTNAFREFKGIITYPGDNASWTDKARNAWAPNATWKNGSTIVYDATGDTEMVDEGTGTATTIRDDEVQDVVDEIRFVKPEHVIVNAKVSEGTAKVKASTTQIPASIARAAEDVGATFAADTAVGKIALDHESVAGDIPEGTDSIELNITDRSGTDTLTLLHNVEFKTVKGGDQTNIIQLSGNAQLTLPNPKGIVKEDVINSQVEDEDGSFVDIKTVRGATTFTATTKRMGLLSSRVKKNLSNAKITGIASAYTYNGKARKPKFSVKMKDGTPVAAKNYSVTWKANKKVGTATVKITAKGNRFCGSKSKTFRINPKKPGRPIVKAGKKLIKVTMRTKVSTTGGTRYEVRYKLANKGKWKTIRTSKKTITIKKLKKGKKYKVRVRAMKGKYKSKYSSAATSGKVK